MLRRLSRVTLTVCMLSAMLFVAEATSANANQTVQVLMTDPNSSARLKSSTILLRSGESPEADTIIVDPSTRYQSIKGFGASFTDASAWLISDHLNDDRRNRLMKDLFDPDEGIGMSMIRQPMGATDFNNFTSGTAGLYTYDDQPCGSTDPTMRDFSIAHDEAYILPILRQAIANAKNLTVMATPWSPPAWMRTGACSTLGTLGGGFNPEFYAAYAQYFVKFLKAYQAAGVPVSYVTPQNEPTNELALLPSMNFPYDQEATFVGDHLGPAIADAGLATKILGWDYVWDQASQYPTFLLKEAKALPYLAGTAWHCYGGKPSDMTPIHDLAPTKDTFVTECSGLRSWPQNGETYVPDADLFKTTMNLFVDSTRNWARSVILWNIALDSTGGPSNGCYTCRPLVNIDYDLLNGWVANPQIEYYAMGQVAKWVRPGAVRIDSTTSSTDINNAVFTNTDGSKVLVAVNNASTERTFGVQLAGHWFNYRLPAGAAATFRW